MKQRFINPLARAMLVIAAVMTTVSGVTFAALQSQQAKSTGNTIQTATANLLVSRDGTGYDNTQPGFTFANLIPGGQPSPSGGYPLFLKNAGGTPLSLKLAVSSTPSNPDGVDLTKVSVILTPNGGQPQTYPLQSLITAGTGGGMDIGMVLVNGAVKQFSLQVSMATDAFSGASASIGGIDFSFSGVAVN